MQTSRRSRLQPDGQPIEDGAADAEDSLHAGGQAGCEGVNACLAHGLYAGKQCDFASRQRAEAVGQPDFRIGDAGQIDARSPGAMAGAGRAVGHVHRGV